MKKMLLVAMLLAPLTAHAADDYRVHLLVCPPGYLCEAFEVLDYPSHNTRSDCDTTASYAAAEHTTDLDSHWVCFNETEKQQVEFNAQPFRAPAPINQP